MERQTETQREIKRGGLRGKVILAVLSFLSSKGEASEVSLTCEVCVELEGWKACQSSNTTEVAALKARADLCPPLLGL